MLDIKFIRENKDLVQAAAQKKHINLKISDLIEVDDRRRQSISIVENKRTEQNQFTDKISRTTDPVLRNSMISQMKTLKVALQKEESKLKEIVEEWQKLMVQVPNIPDISVPEGEGDKDNKEIRVWGEKKTFNFSPKSHVDIMVALNIVDFEKGAEVAGFRGYFLKNAGAELSFAIWNYAKDFWCARGFEFMLVPSLVKRHTLLGSGYLPQGEEDLYKTQDGDYLAGTGEVSTMAYFAKREYKMSELPKKILAFSPCFRREAGAHGKDVKGLIRVHEFFKMEQVVICEASHEKSVALHEEINGNTEEFIKSLNIPFRTVVNCGGDLGLGQVKKYDIELWVPGENTYREISSASYFHDFQSRRLTIRYRDSDNKLCLVHSLNATAIPTPRILVSLIENYQQEDGSILIPEVLQKYMGGKKVIQLDKNAN